MYQSLYNFAKSRGLIMSPVKENLSIFAHIVVSKDGDLRYVDVHGKDAPLTPCPSIGTLAYASGSIRYVCPICEKIITVLYGAADKKGEVIGDDKKYDAWKRIMKEASDSVPELIPVYRFIMKADTDTAIRQDVYEKLMQSGAKVSSRVSFSIEKEDGRIDAEKMHEWEEWFFNWISKNGKGSGVSETAVSAITGDTVGPLTDEAFPKVMVKGITGTGAYIASFGEEAFTSYGFERNRNLPMSKEEALSLKAAIEYLLCSETNHNDGFNVMYWFDRKDTDAEKEIARYFGTSKEEKLSDKELKVAKKAEASYTAGLQADKEDRKAAGSTGRNNVLHVMNYTVASQGRMYFSMERQERYGDLRESLKAWDNDTALEVPVFENVQDDGENKKAKMVGYASSGIGSAWSILGSLLDSKDPKNFFERVKKEYGNERTNLFYAVCFRDKIPNIFYDRALRKITTANVTGDNVQTTALKVVKAYLIRNGGLTMIQPDLNKNLANPAYLLGRWLAVVEKMQIDSADKKPAVTVANSYYRAFKSKPAEAFSEVNNMANIYSERLERRNRHGAAVFYENILAGIAENLGTDVPEKLDKKQRGLFDLGYYQQKGELYKKRTNAEEPGN